MWTKFITREILAKARRVSPNGYAALAGFVRAESLDLDVVLRACEKHRRAQAAAVRVTDRRLSKG